MSVGSREDYWKAVAREWEQSYDVAQTRVRVLEEALTTIADAHPSGTLAAVSLLAREVLAAKQDA